jgi:MFS family permease
VWCTWSLVWLWTASTPLTMSTTKEAADMVGRDGCMCVCGGACGRTGWCSYSDSVPIFGYRRRSYLFLCGITGGLGWLGMATFVNEPKLALAMLTLGSLGTAVSDVVVDSIVVERARVEGQTMAGQLQSICWASAAVGGLISAYFSGSLLQDFGPRYGRPSGLVQVLYSQCTAVCGIYGMGLPLRRVRTIRCQLHGFFTGDILPTGNAPASHVGLADDSSECCTATGKPEIQH